MVKLRFETNLCSFNNLIFISDIESERMATFSDPVRLKEDVLPTELDIYKHYLYLNAVKIQDRTWVTNTPVSKKAGSVMTDVAAIWSKTGIPFDLAGYPGEKRIMYVINKGRTLNKVGMERRGEEFGQELDVLFDIASCKHVDGGIACSCSIKDKVPTTWRLFLADQRTQRQMLGVLKSDRYLTLRTAAQGRDSAEEESRQAVRYKVEEIERKKKEEHDRKKKADEAVAMLFSKAPIEAEDIEIEETDIEQEVEDKSDDSDWEDIDENLPKRKYNCMSLKYFARECDRYGISDRAGAKIGNGLLKDMGLVNKEDMEKLICQTKLRRERRKWGVILEKEENALQLPQALYTDGKKVPT